MQGTPHSSAAPDRRRIKSATFRVSPENLASKNLTLRNRLDQKLGTRGGVAFQRFRKSRGASRRAHLGSRWAFSQSLRRTCSTSSWFSPRRAWFWLRRSCTWTAARPAPLGLRPSRGGDGSAWDRELVPAAALSPQTRPGLGPSTGGQRRGDYWPEKRQPAGRKRAEESDFVAALTDFRRLRGAGPPAASGAGRAGRCLK